MKCHDGEECKHGCADENMRCAVPMLIADELRSGLPIGPARRSAIAAHVERLEQIALYRGQDQRELAAYKKAIGTASNYVCDSECEPRCVTFADGRIVRVVGEGYLEIERAKS